MLDKAKILAGKLHCEIIDMSGMTFTVEDFVSIIKYALYVITTSFHATAFSLIMETPCYAVRLGDGFDGRYVDLLREVGADAEIVDKDFEPVPFNVDFNVIKNMLYEYKKKSVNYLNNI